MYENGNVYVCVACMQICHTNMWTVNVYVVRLCGVCLCMGENAGIMFVCSCVCAGTGLWRLAQAAAVVETYFNS